MDVSAVAEARSRPYCDAISGTELDDQRVAAARLEELQEFERRDVHTKVPAADASGGAGKEPVSAPWVGLNKVDEDSPKFRSAS